MEKYDNPGEFDDESTSDKTGETGKEAEKELKRLAEMENKQICFWKTAVVGILVLAGTAISVGINIYLKDQQEHEIDHNVSTSQTERILESWVTRLEKMDQKWISGVSHL